MRDVALAIVRMSRALACLGIAPEAQEHAMQLPPGTLGRVESGEQTTDVEVLATCMQGLYRRHAGSMPLAGARALQVRGRALRAGWFPPMAWEPGQLADPLAVPIGLDRQETRAAWVQTYLVIAGRPDMNTKRIARAFGLTLNALGFRVRRAQRDGMLPRNGRELAPCGTPAAAERHRRHGEDVDEACKQAKQAYQREMRELAKQRDGRATR